MVRHVLSLMTREIRGLHEAAYILAFFTFFSQVLALIRDRTFAHFFGASATLDAYFAAFRIPDVVFAFLTLFVSAFALIPMLAERGGHQSDSSRALIGGVLLVFGVIAIFVSGILFFLIPVLVPILFAGFDGATIHNVEMLSRIMLLQPVLLGLSSIVASVVQSSRRFFLYALAPIFYNAGIIVGALFLYPAFGTAGLAWGVVLGAALHLMVQVIPLMYREPSEVCPAWSPRLSGEGVRSVWRVCVLSLPRALALSANQVLLLAFASAASLAAVGSVTALSFGFNLQSVPLSIIAVSYASALFPALTLLYTSGQRDKFILEVWAAIRHIIFWTAPAIALMVVLRAHVVRIILGSGEFGWDETRLTAAIVALFAFSLIAQGAILVFSRAYYAAGRSLEPIVINVGAALVAGALAFAGVVALKEATITRFFLEDLFRISGVPGAEVIMIPLAYSGVIIISACIFGILFARRFGFEKRVITTFFHASAASIIAASSAYATLQITALWLRGDTFMSIFTQGLLGGMVGVLVWAGALSLLKSPEFAEVLAVGGKLVQKMRSRLS